MNILVLNGGSSSFKCWFGNDPDAPPLWTARADWSHHTGVAEIRIQRRDGVSVSRSLQVNAPVAVLAPVLESLWNGDAKVIPGPRDVSIAGHRIVHGGPDYRETTLLRPEVRAAIAKQVESPLSLAGPLRR